jgi:ATP-dependent DNA helicase RecQ
MALTATANERTREEIADRLALDNPRFFISSFDRPNIRYLAQPKIDPRKQLLAFIKTHPGESGIIYCLSRKKVEQTAEWLGKGGFTALPYHAGFSGETRRTHQQRFLVEDGVIMVATIAFGMGIDKPDVRFVAHLDLPKSLEAYYQETGRAGRDGLSAEAWMVFGLQDVVRLSRMLSESEANEQFKRVERSKLDALLGWCETTSCRRISLLQYFGESMDAPCGNCDNCLTPPETWDATEEAQKLLSCIVRTGQRFGAGHVIDVLTGKQTDKVEQYRHDQLSTFGLGQSSSAQHWRSVIRQLIVQGFLQSDMDRFGALRLNESSRPLLRGEINLTLREDVIAPMAVTKPRFKGLPALSDQDTILWKRLRQCRLDLARENGVPPYVIFHDSTLEEMIRDRPTTPDELLEISGIGVTKLNRYGAQFLSVLIDAANRNTN